MPKREKSPSLPNLKNYQSYPEWEKYKPRLQMITTFLIYQKQGQKMLIIYSIGKYVW